MKKIAMFIAAAAMAVSASAQKTVVTASKPGDNIYIGVNAGAMTTLKSTKTNETGQDPMRQFEPEFGVRVGKNFTTVFGLAVDANVIFKGHGKDCDNQQIVPWESKTLVQYLDVDLLGTANLMNLFAGYKGTPRCFEISALGGFGWTHAFGYEEATNAINSKAGLNFAYNFGKDKQFQIYLEPMLTFYLQRYYPEVEAKTFEYDANRAIISLKAGFNYKFPCSNGKHNFTFEQLRDQSLIDGLNAKINGLRSDLDKANAANAAATANVAKLQQALTECQNKPAPVVEEQETANLQPSVVFSVGKSNVEASQMANVQMIANYMKANPTAKVKISGYASPEGNAELNQKLSEARANAVKEVLVKKYKISADRLTAEGLGATDKLFDEVEFNRVALFNDTTK